jgi:hypothetical protein
VTEASPLLTRDQIEAAFRRLGERLARRGAVADLYVIGGAAMAMAYDARSVDRASGGRCGRGTLRNMATRACQLLLRKPC